MTRHRELKAQIPGFKLWVATYCKTLGVKVRTIVPMKDSSGSIFNANKFCNVANLIDSYKNNNRADLVKYAEDCKFSKYRPARQGETPAEKAQRETKERHAASDIERWKKEAAFSRPDVVTAKRKGMKWALALEFPTERDNRSNEVHREAPLAMARRVIYDIEKAAEVVRHDPANKQVEWLELKCKEGLHVVTSDSELLAAGVRLSAKAMQWLLKAQRHNELFHEMLAEWVEENERELCLHAVMYNLYYNSYQVSVDSYITLIKNQRVVGAVSQFNVCHMKHIKEQVKRYFAKMRYFVYIRHPMRLSKICWYWFGVGAQHASRPADPTTGFQGGRYWKEFVDSQSEFDFVKPAPPPPEMGVAMRTLEEKSMPVFETLVRVLATDEAANAQPKPPPPVHECASLKAVKRQVEELEKKAEARKIAKAAAASALVVEDDSDTNLL